MCIFGFTFIWLKEQRNWDEFSNDDRWRTAINLTPLLTNRCQPKIGMTQSNDKPQAKPMRNNARARVRLPRYCSGDVIDQYRSRLNVNKLNIDAVDAVKSIESQIWQRTRPKIKEKIIVRQSIDTMTNYPNSISHWWHRFLQTASQNNQR